ncbi:MerR family transcriptional regulator [Streptomyces sedi]
MYPIGDVARRTGLRVSAIRFYADAGVVEPSALTSAGHRLYDVEAVARLELVRTLRELGAGLEEIRRLLAGRTTLHELATAHLAVVEEEASRLRARRSVLRALVRRPVGAEQAALVHRLVSLSDEERERLVEEFWADVSEGLEENPRFVADLNAVAPRLPDEPTPGQLDAWIELASLVGDPGVRRAVRADLNERFGDGVGRLLVSPGAWDSYARGEPLLREAVAALRAGVDPDSAAGRELGERYLAWLGGMLGASFEGAASREVAERLLLLEPEVLADLEREARGPSEDDPFARYRYLVQVVDGTLAANQAELAGYAAAFTWLARALAAE